LAFWKFIEMLAKLLFVVCVVVSLVNASYLMAITEDDDGLGTYDYGYLDSYGDFDEVSELNAVGFSATSNKGFAYNPIAEEFSLFANDRLSFQRLFTFDESTGLRVASPIIYADTFYNFVDLQYDAGLSADPFTLFVLPDDDQPTLYLGTIDVQLGDVTTLDYQKLDSIGYVFLGGTVDTDNDIYYVLLGEVNNGGWNPDYATELWAWDLNNNYAFTQIYLPQYFYVGGLQYNRYDETLYVVTYDDSGLYALQFLDTDDGDLLLYGTLDEEIVLTTATAMDGLNSVLYLTVLNSTDYSYHQVAIMLNEFDYLETQISSTVLYLAVDEE